MNFLTALLAIGFLVSGVVVGMSFIPNQDIMIYGADGELKTLWGEHSFYQDTISFGHPVTYHNGTFFVGGNHARAS